jgi:glucose dehydrogenase
MISTKRSLQALLVTTLAAAGIVVSATTANAQPDGGFQEIRNYKVLNQSDQFVNGEWRHYETREYRQKTCVEYAVATQDGGTYTIVKCW